MSAIVITKPVSTIDGAAILRAALAGYPCTSIEKAEQSWHFGFPTDQASLALECPWRLRSNDSIEYGYEDDAQQFGLSEPVDGVARSKHLVGTSPVMSVEIQEGCGDLSIEFENGARLEVFNASAGYESWTFNTQSGLVLVAQGGGNLALWDPTTVSERLL